MEPIAKRTRSARQSSFTSGEVEVDNSCQTSTDTIIPEPAEDATRSTDDRNATAVNLPPKTQETRTRSRTIEHIRRRAQRRDDDYDPLLERRLRQLQSNISRPGQRSSQRVNSSAASEGGDQTPPVRSVHAAVGSRLADKHYLGPLTILCADCSAKHFIGEQTNRHRTTFTTCCNIGRLEFTKFQDFPPMLRDLFQFSGDETSEVKALKMNFKAMIRNLNSSVAMASMGGHIDPPRGVGPYCFRIHGQLYHNIGSLHPVQGQPPTYGQLYILDTSEATKHRIALPQNERCNPVLIERLGRLISQCNAYAKSFRMMAEVEQAEILAAEREKRPRMKLTMVFDDVRPRGLEGRRYDLPTANEVAIVYVGDDGDVPASRSLVIHDKQGQIKTISHLDKRCDTLTYPLFFPRGEDGWNPDLRDSEGNRVTQKQYYSYLLSIRDAFNPILYGGKLFQQFAVDAFVKIEQNRLNYCRLNQSKLRADSYQGLQDFMAGDAAGPPGRRIVLPSTFIGSPRHMQQNYQDAMAIVARFGKPDLFITITCNPKWKEIQENLYPGQSAEDRPDLISRVFKLKLDAVFDDLLKKKVFGEVLAHVRVVEFQKRGLPHCHALLILEDHCKPRTPDDIDEVCSAEIPDPLAEPELHEAVKNFMVHRNCTVYNPEAPCSRNGVCSKKFPKEFRAVTSATHDGYPLLRRRNAFSTVIGNNTYGDEWVVPYNPFLLLRYNCHINVEICGMISSVKYHLNARYVCAPEALHRIQGYELQYKSHTIYRLAVHLPNQRTIMFIEGRERNALQNAGTTFSTLTAYFRLNEIAVNEASTSIITRDVRDLYYNQIPDYYVFNPKTGWSQRKRGASKIIGRMYTVSPRDSERYALRLLLLNVKGSVSFDCLKTVDGILHNTFMDAAKALGLMNDDTYIRKSLEEAAIFQSPALLRSFFACLLAFCEVFEVQSLWDDFVPYFIEDFLHQGSPHEVAVASAYYDVSDRLSVLNIRFETFVSRPGIERPIVHQHVLDFDQLLQQGTSMYSTLNPGQKQVTDAILSSFQSNMRCFFINGPGGSGKTYVYHTLYNLGVGRQLKILCVAWTGIAANLLPEGRTVSSVFKLNIGDNNRSSSMKRQSKEAARIAELDMLIWDEISMVPKPAFEAVDALLRDIRQNDQPFGGIIVVVGGDFRQTLPIVERGSMNDIIQTVEIVASFQKISAH